MPSNLNPPLDQARNSKAAPFNDGCDDSFNDATVHHCLYGDPNGKTTVVLLATRTRRTGSPRSMRSRTRHLRLINISKATCPPMPLPVYSPVLGRNFNECDQFRQNAMARIAQEHPGGRGRRRCPPLRAEYHFQVFADPWINSLRTLVTQLRAIGPR